MRVSGHRVMVLAVTLWLGCGGTATSPHEEPDDLAAVSTPAPVSAEDPQCSPVSGRLCPVDEGTSDPSFSEFRQQMLAAISGREADALLGLIDPAIRTSFGEGGGIEEFKRIWKPDSEGSALWDELTQVLRLGGTFLGEGEERSFWAPYVYSAWPDEFDAFTHVAATGSRVLLRAQPTDASAAVATADWSILEVLERQVVPGSGWLEVRDASGSEGFVRDTEVRSPIGYRAGFVRHGTTWRLNALVAGD